MAPAATSARPAVRMMEEGTLAPDRPAARAKGTVRPSETPRMTSLTTSPAMKWFSLCTCRRGDLPASNPSSTPPPLPLISAMIRETGEMERDVGDGRKRKKEGVFWFIKKEEIGGNFFLVNNQCYFNLR